MKNSKIIRVFVALLFWICLWQWGAWELSRHVQWSDLLLPFPMDVLKRLTELMGTAHFWLTALYSLGRVFAAFLAGAVIGSLFAVLCALSPLLSALISPAMTVVRATPIASFIVLLILWLPGAGWVSFVAAVLMTAPIFWANLGRGMESVDPKLLEMSAAYRFSRGQKLKHIYLPQIRPALASACEIGVGLAWKAGVAAEVLTRPELAIGRMVYETRMYLETADLFAWTALVVALSLLVEKGVRHLVRKAVRDD